MPIHNRPDEWKIEQGLSGAKLPILDQTGLEPRIIQTSAMARYRQRRSSHQSSG